MTEMVLTESNENATAGGLLEKIQEYGGDQAVVDKLKEFGVETIDDLKACDPGDLEEAGLKRVQAKKLVKELNAAVPAGPVAAPAAGAASPQIIVNNVLPDVGSDESWLTSLRTGGVLKIEESTVIAAVRSALAKKVGLFEVPEKLVELMEKTADETDEPVSPKFYELRKQVTRRNYADVFAAIDGLDGSFVTDKRKKQLFSRMDEYLWPALAESYHALCGWYASWRDSVSDPTILLGALTGMGTGVPLATPDTAPLDDASSSLKDSVNRVFSGTGVQITAATAYEAQQIVKALEDPQLPAMTGAVNREQMLKKLGTAVSANYTRLERDLIKYTIAFIGFEDKAGSGNEAIQYASQLWQLGNSIDWSQLGIRGEDGISSVTGRRVL